MLMRLGDAPQWFSVLSENERGEFGSEDCGSLPYIPGNLKAFNAENAEYAEWLIGRHFLLSDLRELCV